MNAARREALAGLLDHLADGCHGQAMCRVCIGEIQAGRIAAASLREEKDEPIPPEVRVLMVEAADSVTALAGSSHFRRGGQCDIHNYSSCKYPVCEESRQFTAGPVLDQNDGRNGVGR